MSILERLRLVRALLTVTTLIIGITPPLLTMSERLRWTFALSGVVGFGIGYRWGHLERPRYKAGAKAPRLILCACGFLLTYLVLETGLPKLGRTFPVIYEDPYFWSLVAVRVVLWGFFVGTLARLFASLHPR